MWLAKSPFGAGLFRVLGADAAEVAVITCRPELQGQGFARVLLRHLEAALIRQIPVLTASQLSN